MTLKQLKDRINVRVCLRGRFNYEVRYKGKSFTLVSNDTPAYDVIRSGEPDENYTLRQAYQALWDEAKTQINKRY